MSFGGTSYFLPSELSIVACVYDFLSLRELPKANACVPVEFLCASALKPSTLQPKTSTCMGGKPYVRP